MIICHVEESLGRRIDKAVLLPDGKDVPIQAQFLEGLIANASHFHTLRTLDIGVSLAVLVEQVSNLDHLLISIPTGLIA